MFNNSSNSLFEKQLHWSKFEYESDVKLLKEFPIKGRKFIFHENYIVYNYELKNFFADNNISKVFLCGVFTDVCIIKAAMDMFDNNIEVFVIMDCCNSLHGLNNHKYTLDTLKRVIGDNHVISSNDLVNFFK